MGLNTTQYKLQLYWHMPGCVTAKPMQVCVSAPERISERMASAAL